MGASAVFLIGFSVTFMDALYHVRFCSQILFPRAAFLLCFVVLLVKPWKARVRVSLLLRALLEVSHITCGNPCWN